MKKISLLESQNQIPKQIITNKNQKVVTIFTVILIIATIGLSIYDIIILLKCNHQQKMIEQLNDRIQKNNQDKIRNQTYRTLKFNHLQNIDLHLNIDNKSSPIIQILDLQGSKIDSFFHNRIDSLKALIIDQAPLIFFWNSLNGLQQFKMSNRIYQIDPNDQQIFATNTFQSLKHLNLSTSGKIKFQIFYQNYFPNLQYFEAEGIQFVNYESNDCGALQNLKVEVISNFDDNRFVIENFVITYVNDIQNPLEIKNFTNNILYNLSNLTVKSNESVFLNFSSNYLSTLQNLEISNQYLSIFVNNTLKDLQHLNLQYNQLTQFQNNTFFQLKSMRLNNNKLKTFKNYELTQLTTLDIRDNLLEQVSNNHLPNLNLLDLSNQNLSIFELNYLPGLRALNLSSNSLQNIKNNELDALQFLYLDNNLFSDDVADELINLNLNNITYIDLQRNELIIDGSRLKQKLQEKYTSAVILI